MTTHKRPRRAPDSFASANLATLVGSTTLHRIDNPDTAPLRIGTRTWSVHALATRLGVANTRAARLLTIAAASIDARSVQDLYRRSTPYTFAGVAGFGEVTMYVLWRLFESEGLDPDAWATSGPRGDALTSFHAMKAREREAEARTVREARRRTGRRTATLKELDAAAAR